MSWQISFIMWRETVEALLVVGILHAWLFHETSGPQRRRGASFLWGGVAAGLAAAGALGAVLLFSADLFGDEGQDYFQIGMVFIATTLIVQMVFWMRKRGRTLKKDLHAGLAEAAGKSNWWGVFVLAMIAVAREGSETVVFLYGSLASASGLTLAASLAAAALGFGAALLTYTLLQWSSHAMSWKLFFRITEVLLLLLASSLLLTGVDRLIGLDLVSSLTPALWDTSTILDDGGVFGGLVSALTGYRARPDLMQLIAYAGFWLTIWLLFRNGVTQPRKAQS